LGIYRLTTTIHNMFFVKNKFCLLGFMEEVTNYVDLGYSVDIKSISQGFSQAIITKISCTWH